MAAVVQILGPRDMSRGNGCHVLMRSLAVLKGLCLLPPPNNPRHACSEAPDVPPDTVWACCCSRDRRPHEVSRATPERQRTAKKAIIAGISDRHMPGKEISLAGDRVCSPTQEGTVAARQPVQNDDPGQRHGQVQQTTRGHGSRHDLGSSECHST